MGSSKASVSKGSVRTLVLLVAMFGMLNGCSRAKEREDFSGPHAGQGGGAAPPDLFGNVDGGPDHSNTWTGDASGCAPDEEPPCGPPEPDASHPDDPAMPDAGTVTTGPDARVMDPVDDPDPPEDPEPDAAVEDPPLIDAGEDPTPTAATYKVDLLFVVDNSGSMREEQIALREQFPMLISRLLENTAIGGGAEVVAGAQDIHLGVVSTDMGAIGVAGIPGCDNLGDDGVLRSTSSVDAAGCSAATFAPPFLSYVAGTDDVVQLATDLGCISTLGTDGCGFEQQLESALKAVWPGSDDRVSFLTDLAGFGGTGQSGLGFPNADFIRSDVEDPSLVAVVLVTDEEDCSSSNTRHLQPEVSLPLDEPLRNEGLNTRCYHEGLRPEPNRLYDVTRYVSALRALRPGQEHLVVFGAIAGVPPALVTPAQLSTVDFTDADERDAFYAALLSAPGMQEAVDDRGTVETADDSMVPSCMSAATARAYPPRRIVQVVQGFEQNGFVQSICADDWSPAMELLATRIAEARRIR